MSAVEDRINSVMNILNSKQARSGSLTIDRLVVHQPINIGNLSIENLTVGDLKVNGTLTTNGLQVNKSANFGGNVNMTGSTNITNLNTTNFTPRELRNVTIKGWLSVETNISASGTITANGLISNSYIKSTGEIRSTNGNVVGIKVHNAIWN